MAYTIGASHGPFTGNGSFAIAKPNGIRSILSGIPSHTGHDGSIPRRYFKLGRMSLGNAHGFQFSHGLEYVQQLLYPVAPVWEILAYDIRDGASCTFYELIDVPDLTLKMPWDRTPLVAFSSATAYMSGGATDTVMFTYTVPTLRRLQLTSFRSRIARVTVFTTIGGSYATGYINGTRAFENLYFGNVVGQESNNGFVGAPLILNAGDVIRVNGGNTDVGGQVRVEAAFTGFLFDA